MQTENDTEEIITTENRPIGSNEGDLEAVLLDGCLGFSLSVGNAVLYLIVALLYAESPMLNGALGVYSALLVILLLFVGSVFTDFLQTSAGRFLIRWTHMLSFVGACVFMVIGQSFLSVTLGSIGMVIAFFLYGRFLASLARKALMLVIDSLFVYIGLMAILSAQLDFQYIVSILGVATVISVVISGVFINRKYEYAPFVSAANSKERSINVHGNNHTLFMLGFAFSIAILAFFVHVEADIVVAALGMAVGLAGVLSIMLRQVDEHFYKESLKKTIALTVTICLMVIPILPDMWKLIVVCIFVCITSLNIIVLINAVVETTRFNQISPIWLIGQEGSVFFAGILLGGFLFSGASYLEQQFEIPHIMYIAFIVAVVLCAYMQIKVNYQIYPFEPIIENSIDEDVRTQIEEEGKHRMIYRQKVEAVCDKYRLSPREREVIRILLKGRDAKYIMDTFYISQSTAKTHIYNIYRKLDVHSRQELMDLVDDMELELPDGQFDIQVQTPNSQGASTGASSQ